MRTYDWKSRGRFVNREGDLRRLETWWADPTRDAIALLGRRRVGKSWLFRRFAHGKPSVILVADELLPSTQMTRFAGQLEPWLGFRPEVNGIAGLIELLYRLGTEEKILAVIDEFPFLLPDGQARRGVLTEVQAVMERYRDESATKLVLCGSLIGQMTGLLDATSPLHGRLQPLDVKPLDFSESRELSDSDDSPEQRIIRYAVTGGMARYLDELGHGPLERVVCERVLDRRGPLFNDPRAVLEAELRSPAMYLSILEELSANAAMTQHLTQKLQVSSGTLAPYLDTLREMQLIVTTKPVGASPRARSTKHAIADGFIRFWFRFVLPNQDGLQTGLDPGDLWGAEVEPQLPGYVAAAFEELCGRYVRIAYGADAPRVGAWWGNARNELRRSGERFTEEIDVVAARGRKLRIVGECKWTAGKMEISVLDDLRRFKVPALAQEGRLDVPAAGPQVLLFARSGFRSSLVEAAAADEKITLIDLQALIAGLDGRPEA